MKEAKELDMKQSKRAQTMLPLLLCRAQDTANGNAPENSCRVLVMMS
jgi:hypothetical protein